MTAQLTRQIGLLGAVALGFGSIVGTGVFVSLGIAIGITGSSVVFAICLAACVALLSGLSSAQLAAAHPVSGGTYEYGYRLLNPTLGFVAGWMFLFAKSLSAATAALGLSAYTLAFLDVSAERWSVIGLAVGVVAAMAFLVAGGIRRSIQANYVIVALTLLSLSCFVVVAISATGSTNESSPFATMLQNSITTKGIPSFLESVAILFVAFTGYGRIATMGEEVVDPERTIPRAIIITLLAITLLYCAVGFAAISSVGSEFFSAGSAKEKATMLQAAIEILGHPWVGSIVAVGAIVAMLGVLLNLILGLSRVVLAMGRRGDLPKALAVVDPNTATPRRAVLGVGLGIGLITMVGDVRTTWTFSAFTVLIYYALTNLSALRLPAVQRRYPTILAWSGLLSCLSLAFWVPNSVIAIGAILILAGLLARFVFRRASAGGS